MANTPGVAWAEPSDSNSSSSSSSESDDPPVSPQSQTTTNRRQSGMRNPRDGMELAHRCGATPLADRAFEELRAAGGRPPRRAGAGADPSTYSKLEIRSRTNSPPFLNANDRSEAAFLGVMPCVVSVSGAVGVRPRH